MLSSARLALVTGCLVLAGSCWSSDLRLRAYAPPAIVPSPTTMTMERGRATLHSGSTIYYGDPSAQGAAELLSGDLDRIYGLAPAVASGSSSGAGDVELRLITDPSLDGEGYRLTVSSHVSIEATGVDGLFAGAISLVQAVIPSGGHLIVPRMTIEDSPFKSQRALMVDVKNHWHSIAELRKFVDLCRFYKVRHLCLHTGEPQWIGSAMSSTAGIPAADRESQRLYTQAEIDGLIAYAAGRGVYLFPHNETTEGFSTMRHALQNDFDGPGGHPNWVQEAYTEEGVDFGSGNPEGLDGYVDSAGSGVDASDPDYWKSIAIFTERSYAQFAAGYPAGDLPYYHMGPVLGEGGTSPDNAAIVLDILREVDADVQLMFWNGPNAAAAGGLTGREEETIVCFYTKQFSASDIYGYLDTGWPLLNSTWSPLYIVGTGVARTQQQVHDDWNTFRTGTDGFTGFGFSYDAVDWDEFDTPAAHSLVTGGMLCTWEVPASIHLDRVRIRLPAMAEHAWQHETWPYPADGFADFRARYVSADALVPALLGITLQAPGAPAGLEATDSELANAIEISWQGSAGFPDGYRVLRFASDDLGSATQVAEIAVDESYTDTDVTVNTPYFYWVTAFNKAGESAAAGSVLGSAGDGIVRVQAHEPFDYSPGESIHGQDGGEGWESGGWNVTSANGLIATDATNLTYSNLPTSGGALRVHPATDNPSVDIRRDMADEMGTGGTTVWLSYLFRGEPRADGHAFMRFGTAPGIGKRWGSEFAFENDGSGIFMDSYETYFIVVRFDFGAADDMYMWINPSLGAEPGVVTADHSVTADAGVDDELLINIQGWGQGNYLIDEIRIGPTWAYATGD